MLIPSGEGEGMVNSQLVTQGNFNSPSRGLAVVVKKRIPTTRGSASRGRNLFFTTPAKPWLGELKLPFVTRWEFIIPTTRGFATRGRNYTIPSPPPEGITSMLRWKRKDLHLAPTFTYIPTTYLPCMNILMSWGSEASPSATLSFKRSYKISHPPQL